MVCVTKGLLPKVTWTRKFGRGFEFKAFSPVEFPLQKGKGSPFYKPPKPTRCNWKGVQNMRLHIDFQRIRTLWTMPQSGLVANVDCKWTLNFGIWLWLNQKGCLNYGKNASISVARSNRYPCIFSLCIVIR